jgi:hypothetical protein
MPSGGQRAGLNDAIEPERAGLTGRRVAAVDEGLVSLEQHAGDRDRPLRLHEVAAHIDDFQSTLLEPRLLHRAPDSGGHGRRRDARELEALQVVEQLALGGARKRPAHFVDGPFECFLERKEPQAPRVGAQNDQHRRLAG